MSDKERLEEIKARKHLLERNGYDLSYTNEDINWLIEQTERVEFFKEQREAYERLYLKEKEHVKRLERQGPGVELNLLNDELARLEELNKRYIGLLAKIENNMGLTDEENDELLEEIADVLNGRGQISLFY